MGEEHHQHVKANPQPRWFQWEWLTTEGSVRRSHGMTRLRNNLGFADPDVSFQQWWWWLRLVVGTVRERRGWCRFYACVNGTMRLRLWKRASVATSTFLISYSLRSMMTLAGRSYRCQFITSSMCLSTAVAAVTSRHCCYCYIVVDGWFDRINVPIFFPVAPRRIELRKEGQNMLTSLMASACAVQQLFISQHSLYPYYYCRQWQ